MGLMVTIDSIGSIADSTAAALAHGCNTRGVMGVGAALAIRTRYSERMFLDYVQRCREGTFRPGDVYAYEEPGQPVLYNLGIQPRPGKHARLEWVDQCLSVLASDVVSRRLPSLSITPLGSVHGGLDRPLVVERIAAVFGALDVDVTIHTHPEQYRPASQPNSR